jgi:hypothetical protein
MSTKVKIHEAASGDIAVWAEQGGCICLKICNAHRDPVELSEEEALELAAVLTRLVDEVRGGGKSGGMTN